MQNRSSRSILPGISIAGAVPENAYRIKFYKKAEVFFPENPPSGNRGTNYTEADYEALRLLEVLTKSGLTCSDIKKLQDGDKSLNEVARSRRIIAEIPICDNNLNEKTGSDTLIKLSASEPVFYFVEC